VIVVLSKRKPAARKDRIVLVNASRRVKKGRPKNYIPQEEIRWLAAAYLAGDPIEGEVTTITCEQAEEGDYNLSPTRWIGSVKTKAVGSVAGLLQSLEEIDHEAARVSIALSKALPSSIEQRARSHQDVAQKDTAIGPMPGNWSPRPLIELAEIWSGGTPRKSVAEYWNGNIPWVSGKDLKAPTLHDTIDHLSAAGVEAGSRLAPGGAVLILVRGMGLAKDLPVAVIARPMSFNQDVKALVPRGECSGRFLRAAIYAGKERLLAKIVPSAHGTMTLNLDDIENFLVPCPADPAEANRIVTLLDAVQCSSNLHRKKRSVIERLSDSLLHNLMTGETRVADLDLSPLEEIEALRTLL
jgi:hypothetical protein